MGTKIKCKYCQTIIESEHVHDLVFCNCERIFIDGGDEYTRIGFQEPEDYDIIDENNLNKG